jgi:hypothetical protein
MVFLSADFRTILGFLLSMKFQGQPLFVRLNHEDDNPPLKPYSERFFHVFIQQILIVVLRQLSIQELLFLYWRMQDSLHLKIKKSVAIT